MTINQSTKKIETRPHLKTYLSIQTNDGRELYDGEGARPDWQILAERDHYKSEEYRILQIQWSTNGNIKVSQGIARKSNDYQIEPREEDGKLLYSHNIPREFLEEILVSQKTAMEVS